MAFLSLYWGWEEIRTRLATLGNRCGRNRPGSVRPKWWGAPLVYPRGYKGESVSVRPKAHEERWAWEAGHFPVSGNRQLGRTLVKVNRIEGCGGTSRPEEFAGQHQHWHVLTATHFQVAYWRALSKTRKSPHEPSGRIAVTEQTWSCCK